MTEATRLKNATSRSSRMTVPAYKISRKSKGEVQKLIEGGHTGRHTQADRLVIW